MDGRAQELSTMTKTTSGGRRARSGWAKAVATLALGLGLLGPVQPVDATSRSIAPPQAASATSIAVSAELVAQLAVGPDPLVRFRALSPGDQQAVVRYLSLASVKTTSLLRRSAAVRSGSSTTGLGAGCWTWKWERDAYNFFGLKLWAYFQQIDWCDDGYTMIGNPQLLNYGSTYFPFWTWVHAGDHVWGGAGQPTFRSWTQADFSLCLTPNIGCIQNTYPWLDMTARANGTASGSLG
jgi:hypothetical protein